MRSVFKKIVGVTLGASMLCSTFVGCGKDKKEEKETNLGDVNQGIDFDTEIGTLVKDGRTDYQIVVPDDADECVRYAATELSKYVSYTTGVSLPIVEDDEIALSLSGKYISLGDTDMLQLADFDIDYGTLNSDGFVTKTLLSSVYISAQRNSGVLYGVYDFCERFLGTRFLTNDYTYTDERTEVVLYETDRTEIPAFSLRYYYAQQSMSQLGFVTRQRQTPVYGKTRDVQYGDGGLHTYYAGMGHTALDLLDPDVYYEEHKDWYTDGGTELCYTNGITDEGELDEENENSMATGMLRVCKEIIRANTTNADTIMIGQPDNSAWCKCARCAASDEKYNSRSGTLLTFINAIAKALEEWNEAEGLGKEINVETFAYWKTIDPPVKDVQTKNGTKKVATVVARDNVAVQIAWMGCSMHAVNDENCSSNLTHGRRFRNWQLCANKLTVWDYATNFYDHFFWYENFDSLVKNYQYYRSIGVTRVMTQGAPHVSNYYQGHLENYVVSKLLWNPNYDVNELIHDFNVHYYGEELGKTADDFVSYMRAYYKTKDMQTKNGFHTELYATDGFTDFEHYSLSFLTGADSMIENAVQQVAASSLSENEKEAMTLRLWQMQIQPQYMILKNYDAYYDPATKKEYATEFMKKIDRLSIAYYGEGKSISDLKSTLGVA